MASVVEISTQHELEEGNADQADVEDDDLDEVNQSVSHACMPYLCIGLCYFPLLEERRRVPARNTCVYVHYTHIYMN